MADKSSKERRHLAGYEDGIKGKQFSIFLPINEDIIEGQRQGYEDHLRNKDLAERVAAVAKASAAKTEVKKSDAEKVVENLAALLQENREKDREREEEQRKERDESFDVDRYDGDEDREYHTPYNVDMPSNTTELAGFINRVQQLPNWKRNFLMDFKTAVFIEEKLGPKFRLSVNQKREITIILRDYILGDIKDAQSQILQKLKVDPNTARKITSVISHGLQDIRRVQ